MLGLYALSIGGSLLFSETYYEVYYRVIQCTNLPNDKSVGIVKVLLILTIRLEAKLTGYDHIVKNEDS